MSERHFETAPEDRISVDKKLVYGLGGLVNNILGGAMGTMMIVLNLGLGMDPKLVGLLGGLPRFVDALTDPLMGYISDNTRSKWGRRRPYIFIGAIVAGAAYILVWQLPSGYSQSFYFWYFLAGSLIFYIAYTVFATPWVALGYELTPDYHERTRLMGVQNIFGNIAFIIVPWCLWFMSKEDWFTDQVEGARVLAIVVGVFAITVGVLPAIFLRERPVPNATKEKPRTSSAAEQMRNFFSGFATTLKSPSFLKLCIATFLIFNGFQLVASFQSYVIIYYVCGGDQEMGATYAGYSGTATGIATLLVIAIVTALATKLGKRRAFFVSTGISMVGYALKWVCYNPEAPWLVLLPAPLVAFGLGGLFTLMPSMIADVVDEDELHTHERREGMYGSIFWWVVKVGMAAALALSGQLLDSTGFDVALGGDQTAQTLFLMRVFDVLLPFIASGIAIWAIMLYPLTEEKAHELRAKLEARRGVAGAADSELAAAS